MTCTSNALIVDTGHAEKASKITLSSKHHTLQAARDAPLSRHGEYVYFSFSNIAIDCSKFATSVSNSFRCARRQSATTATLSKKRSRWKGDLPSLRSLHGRPPVPSSRSPAAPRPCAPSRGSSAPSRASSAPSGSRCRDRPGPNTRKARPSSVQSLIQAAHVSREGREGGR